MYEWLVSHWRLVIIIILLLVNMDCIYSLKKMSDTEAKIMIGLPKSWFKK